MRMVSRVRVTSNGLGLPSRTIVSMTLLPGSPRSGPELSPSSGLNGLPSIAMITSPALMPARAAGVSSIGAITRRRAVGLAAAVPRRCRRRRRAGCSSNPRRVVLVEVDAVRIEVEQQAADRRLHQLLVVDRFDIGLLDRVVDRDIAADLVERHLRGRWRLGGVADRRWQSCARPGRIGRGGRRGRGAKAGGSGGKGERKRGQWRSDMHGLRRLGRRRKPVDGMRPRDGAAPVRADYGQRPRRVRRSVR